MNYTKEELETRLTYLDSHRELIDDEMKTMISSIISPKIKSTLSEDIETRFQELRKLPLPVLETLAKEVTRKNEAPAIKAVRGKMEALNIPEIEFTDKEGKVFDL